MATVGGNSDMTARYLKMIADMAQEAVGGDLPEYDYGDPAYGAKSPVSGNGSAPPVSAGGGAPAGNPANVGVSPSGSETPMSTTEAAAASGSGTPTSTEPGLENLTGWAASQNFNPTELQNLYQNPQSILPYVFAQMAPGSPGYNRLRNLQWDPLAVMMMTQGAGSMMADPSTGGGAGGYANFLANLYQNIGTAGGQEINAAALLRNIFGQQGTSTGDAQTALGQMLGAGDPTQQSRTLYNLVRDLTQAGMNPLAAQAMQAATMNQLDRYNTAMLSQDSANQQSAVDWVRANAPWLTMG